MCDGCLDSTSFEIAPQKSARGRTVPCIPLNRSRRYFEKSAETERDGQKTCDLWAYVINNLVPKGHRERSSYYSLVSTVGCVSGVRIPSVLI